MANFQEICSTDPSKTQNNDSGNVKNVTVLLSSDVTFGEKTGEVLMPNLFEMARIKKPGNGQFKTGIRFSSKMSEKDVEKTLQDEFNILRNHRFCCASVADNRTLNFHGEKRVWDGHFINKNIRGNSSLYILIQLEETNTSGSTRESGESHQQPIPGPSKQKVILPVPQEIQAQGHKAEAAFREAMEKGSVEVYRGRIMLIGQDRAGKTSLKKFLLGIPFDPEEESTVGIKVDPTKFKVEIDQVKNWQFIDHKKLDLSEYREEIAKITAEHMKALEDIALRKSEEDAEGFEQFDSNQGSKAEIDPSTSNVQQNDMPADQDVQLIIDITAGLTLDDVREKVEQCLQGLELNDNVKAKEVILSVWDFAGQNLYYASHSVFLSHRAVYVLVHNLSKDLRARAKPYAKRETRKIELENPTNQTNLDNLLSWLVSVHCIRPTRDEASEVWEEKEEKEEKRLPYLRPPVFVVGTHADKPFKDIKDTLQYIQDSISGKRYDEHVIRPLYAVDNTRSASDYGVQALQNRILEVLKQEPYMGEKVPIRPEYPSEESIRMLTLKGQYHRLRMPR